MEMRSIRYLVVATVCVVGWCISSAQAVPWNNPSGSSPGFFSWENGSNDVGLFGSPIAIANSLVFFPSNFKAVSANGVADVKSDKINVDILAEGNLNITQINIY